MYYGVMFRTRDLLILITSIILTMLIAVIAVMLAPEPERTPSSAPKEVILGEPKEKYEVVPYEDKSSLRDERDAFIEKVRRTYVPQSVEDAKPIPKPEDVIISESEEPPVIITPPPETVTQPVNIVPPAPVPTETASSTEYGNTGL